MDFNRGRQKFPYRGGSRGRGGRQTHRGGRGYQRNQDNFSSTNNFPAHNQNQGYNHNYNQNNEQGRQSGQGGPPQHSAYTNFNFTCEPCDRFFRTKSMLDEHLTEHITCKLDGCKFTAHSNIVLKHIEIQHATNLYSRIKGYETPEEIEKWKAERRQKFPTLEKSQLNDNAKAQRHQVWLQHQDERNVRAESNRIKKMEIAERISRSALSSIIPQIEIEEGEEEDAPVEIKNNLYKANDTPCNDNQSRNRNADSNINQHRNEQPNLYKRTAFPRNKSEIVLLESFYSLVKFSEERGKLIGLKKTIWKGKLEIGDADDGKVFEGEIEKEGSAFTQNFSITDDEDDDEIMGPSKIKESEDEGKKQVVGTNALGSLLGYGSCDSELEEGELEDGKESIVENKLSDASSIKKEVNCTSINESNVSTSTKSFKIQNKKVRSFKLNRIRRGDASFKGRKTLLEKLRNPECNTRLKIQHRRIRRY